MNDVINTGSKLHLHSDDNHYCEPYILLHVLTLQEIKTCLSIMCLSNLSRWQEPTTHPVHLVSYISYPLIIKEAKWPPIFCTSKGALFFFALLASGHNIWFLPRERLSLLLSFMFSEVTAFGSLTLSQTIKIFFIKHEKSTETKNNFSPLMP